jgi:glutamate-1-semialdehyde 2,1-aminomutase
LRECTGEVYTHVDETAATVGKLVSSALNEVGVEHRLQTAGSLFSFFFTGSDVRDYDAARAQQAWRYPPFFHALLENGVYAPPSVFEAWFVSAAHDGTAVERIAAALPKAAAAAARATAPDQEGST